MSSHREDRKEWDLPSFRDYIQLEHESRTEVYDVKFYPYTPPGLDPVFAVVAVQHILICRPTGIDKGIEVLQIIEDKDSGPEHGNNSLAWAKDAISGVPLLCVAGSSALIKVIDALTGDLVQTLPGHGGDINDLAVSPTNPVILASASQDLTIRIWSLHPSHKAQACAVLLAGEGHRETILTIAFHASGGFLLSGGEDHAVNLWAIPEIPSKDTVIEKPTIIHYPHFFTSEVHSNIVDCVLFYNDQILSKAYAEDNITLWQITGFSTPLATTFSAPTTYDHRPTRSAFLPTDSTLPPYTRLLQFAISGFDLLYMRFSLFIPPPLQQPPPNASSSAVVTSYLHPVLAICNSNSKVSFWDLTRLTSYHSYINSPETARPIWLAPARNISTRKDRDKEKEKESPLLARFTTGESNTSDSGTTDSGTADLGRSKELWEKRYGMGLRAIGIENKGEEQGGRKETRVKGLEAHKEVHIPKLRIYGRQVAWSVGGEWCVVVGSPNVIAVLGRASM